jgi:hypothetical protein
MSPAMENTQPRSTRRWPRHHVELPVRVTACGFTPQVVPGLATEISRGGMALYGGVLLQPGDPIEIEFWPSTSIRMTGIVRNRTGYCFGLEFFAEVATESPGITLEVLGDPGRPANPAAPSRAEELAALFWRRHEAYMLERDRAAELLFQEVLQVRQLYRKIDALALRNPSL